MKERNGPAYSLDSPGIDHFFGASVVIMERLSWRKQRVGSHLQTLCSTEGVG